MGRNLKVDVGKSLFGKEDDWGNSVELKRCTGRIIGTSGSPTL